jgi:hypothetical protein
LIIEPTLQNGWYWNDHDYYIKRCLKNIAELLETRAGKSAGIDGITNLVSLPPFIKCSLRSFLRQYPDRFHMTIDINTGEAIVSTLEEFRGPSWRSNATEMFLY